MKKLSIKLNLYCIFLFIQLCLINCNNYKTSNDGIILLLLYNQILESSDGINRMKSVAIDNERILICGGTGTRIRGDSNCLLYENGNFRKIGEMLTARSSNHNMIKLNDGNVFISGGIHGNSTTSNTEIFKANSFSFEPGPKMISTRSRHSLTKLQNGKILIVGGRDSNLNWLKSAEIYDPVTNTIELVGDLNLARGRHSSELLSDGRVLIIGGTVGNQNTNTTEIFDPIAKTFSNGPLLNSPRSYFTSTLLAGDKIVIAGGISDDLNIQGNYLSSIENYNIGLNSFALSSQFPDPKGIHSQVKLSSTKVLFCGGANENVTPTVIEKRCYIYDSVASSVVESASMVEERIYNTMDLISMNKILICGGNNLNRYSNTCEILDLDINLSKIIISEIY
ncbi:Conserved hypothetical lipoprotein [Leptospira biflexa serovar Patoc strain 'Patoc 1 (Ames)']|uniref:Kelch repeat protein n=1 Tax=Leptospira biflexa serovar Patoc (strain Patoc 1 / ATCC 23582 / Paris) TaxID=456481 RepID=B0SK07_LEPBP|nr:kelch repeat-containing protein [Leptospira biflexa]ABZ92968.1 Conserved hypothetical lipoprotein [Leptospira biflexa serovar Patoc strain 'Patoc 1 (Ames)']ABZ96583.1 Hypothetical protein with kelch repeats [Leptospira biflexa serovar Patoc strain 'Patoc 1 (Paris)']